VPDSTPTFELLHCDHCGASIGVYDPFWWQRPDGSVREIGFLAIRDDPERDHPASRFFHTGCYGAATEPAA